MRLSIRSSHLIEYKTQILGQIHVESHVPHNQPIPTRIVLGWLHTTIGRFLLGATTKAFVVIFPFVLVGALIATLLSPIILLWLRGIDRGFTIVITILLVFSNAILFIPLAKFGYQSLGTSPMDMIRDVRRWRRESQRRRAKSKKKKDIQIQELKLDQELVVVASASEDTVPHLRKTTRAILPVERKTHLLLVHDRYAGCVTQSTVDSPLLNEKRSIHMQLIPCPPSPCDIYFFTFPDVHAQLLHTTLFHHTPTRRVLRVDNSS